MTDPQQRLETMNFYRPWCRYCGATEGACAIATENDQWVEDEDDLGFPVCLNCIAKATTQEVLVVERVNKITGTRELLHVVDDIDTAATLTLQHVDGWRQGTDRVWETETPRPGVVLTATPRPVRTRAHA